MINYRIKYFNQKGGAKDLSSQQIEIFCNIKTSGFFTDIQILNALSRVSSLDAATNWILENDSESNNANILSDYNIPECEDDPIDDPEGKLNIIDIIKLCNGYECLSEQQFLSNGTSNHLGVREYKFKNTLNVGTDPNFRLQRTYQAGNCTFESIARGLNNNDNTIFPSTYHGFKANDLMKFSARIDIISKLRNEVASNLPDRFFTEDIAVFLMYHFSKKVDIQMEIRNYYPIGKNLLWNGRYNGESDEIIQFINSNLQEENIKKLNSLDIIALFPPHNMQEILDILSSDIINYLIDKMRDIIRHPYEATLEYIDNSGNIRKSNGVYYFSHQFEEILQKKYKYINITFNEYTAGDNYSGLGIINRYYTDGIRKNEKPRYIITADEQVHTNLLYKNPGMYTWEELPKHFKNILCTQLQ